MSWTITATRTFYQRNTTHPVESQATAGLGCRNDGDDVARTVPPSPAITRQAEPCQGPARCDCAPTARAEGTCSAVRWAVLPKGSPLCASGTLLFSVGLSSSFCNISGWCIRMWKSHKAVSGEPYKNICLTSSFAVKDRKCIPPLMQLTTFQIVLVTLEPSPVVTQTVWILSLFKFS